MNYGSNLLHVMRLRYLVPIPYSVPMSIHDHVVFMNHGDLGAEKSLI